MFNVECLSCGDLSCVGGDVGIVWDGVELMGRLGGLVKVLLLNVCVGCGVYFLCVLVFFGLGGKE